MKKNHIHRASISAILIFTFLFSVVFSPVPAAAQTSGCVTLTKNLYVGLRDSNTGGQVSQLQRFLKAQGYFTYGTITGFFGGVTQTAVQKFQKANGIVSGGTPASTGYGIAGPATRTKIKNLSCGYQTSGTSGTQGTQPVGSSGVTQPCTNGAVFNIVTGQLCSEAPASPVQTPIDPNQPPQPPTPPPQQPQNQNNQTPITSPLLLLQNDYSTAGWSVGYSLGGQKTYLVGGDFGNTVTGTVDLNVLRMLIEGQAGYEAIPQNFSGYAVLDIEDPYFAWLREPTNTQHFQYAQSEMLKALNYAKQLRPNAKWGYYNIPLFPIHFSGGDWVTASAANRAAESARVFQPAQLLAAVDFYAPSIYSPYPNASSPSWAVEKEKARTREATQQSVAHANGKPVFNYISDRFWNSSPVYNYQPMPWDEFQDKQFLGMQYGAKGVFLWGSDHYWYNLGYVYDPSLLPAYALVSREQIRAAFDPWLPVNMTGPAYIDAHQEQTLRLVAEKLYGMSYTPTQIGILGGVGGNDEEDGSQGGPIDSPGGVQGGDDARKTSFFNPFVNFSSAFQAILNLFAGKFLWFR